MLKFTKVRNVKSPQRGTLGSACYDFFVPIDLSIQTMRKKNEGREISYIVRISPEQVAEVPNMNGLMPRDVADAYIGAIKIKSLERVLIPSGIHVLIPDNTMLTVFNKSGIANNKGLVAGSCIIDADYEGEVHLSFINASTHDVYIEAGMKLMQAAIIPIIMGETEEKNSLEELYAGRNSTRGQGGFGSTGLK